MMKDSRTSPGLFLMIVAAVLLLLLFELRPILTPFVLGALIAYLGDPAADWLETRGLGRGAAAGLVFLVISLVFIGIALIMLPMLINQLNTLIHGIPVAYEWLTDTVLPWLREALNLPEEAAPQLAVRRTLTENWQSVGKLLAAAGRYVTGSSMNLFISLGNMVLIPVVAFYLLRDWDRLTPKALHLLPTAWQNNARELASECDEVIGAFLRGQFLVMLSLGVIYSAGLLLVGLELAVLIGTVAGLASVVPYLGTFVGVGAGLVAAFVQFQEWGPVVSVAVVFSIGQLIESYLLTPNLVGDRIGMHPVVVIFVILAGGQLAGFIGVLVALPVGAVVFVLLRHVKDYYKATEFYRAEDQDSE